MRLSVSGLVWSLRSDTCQCKRRVPEELRPVRKVEVREDVLNSGADSGLVAIGAGCCHRHRLSIRLA